jgi:hypothetical protein
MDKEDNMRNPTSPPHRLRDVSDVEGYVRAAIDRVAPAGPSTREALQVHGVQAVLRVERALPPGIPLAPVLDEVLPTRLAALDQGMCRDDPLAAVA